MQLVRAKLWLKHVCLLRHKLVFCSKPLQGSSGNPEIRLYWLGHLEIRDLMGNTPRSEVEWSKFFVISAFVAYRVNAWVTLANGLRESVLFLLSKPYRGARALTVITIPNYFWKKSLGKNGVKIKILSIIYLNHWGQSSTYL